MNVGDFGFDANLNIPGRDTGTPVVYDGINDAVASQQMASGGSLELKNLNIAGIQKMVSPGDDLQAALSAIDISGGGTMLMKGGVYTQKTPLIGYSSTTIQGISPSATIINFEGSSNLSFTGTQVYTTGTITNIASGVFVTGSGTAWLTKAAAGQYLFIGTRHYKIAAVTSDTTLILQEGYADNVTLPASYRISTAIVDVKLNGFSVTGSTGTGITFDDAVQITMDNVQANQNGKGITFTNVSRMNQDRLLAAANTSDGITYTNVGLCDWESVNTVSNGGHNFVLNNVKTVSALMSAVAATSDGFNCTDVDQVLLTVEASGNGGQGIEFVSGCDDNTIDGLLFGNSSDGIKLTATSDRNKIKGNYVGNGGYGINIAASSCDFNTIDVPIFSNNSSGTYNDSGTSTNIVATITQADAQIFTADGTWTKPATAKLVYVEMWGAGGGGGGGGTNVSGGTGGGGGAYVSRIFSVSDLTSTAVVTVGTGGTGGAAQNSGSPGGTSSFGTYLFAYGGGGGFRDNGGANHTGGTGGGSAGAGVIGDNLGSTIGGSPASVAGANGISGQGAGSNPAADGKNAENGGGSGGSITLGTAIYLGGSSLNGGGGGGAGNLRGNTSFINGSAGGTTGSYTSGGGAAGGVGAGSNGANGSAGQGGGGGAGNDSPNNGGNGGNGGIRGGGGGGGGNGGNGGSGTGGTGGTGGRGEVRVYSI